MRIKDNAYCFLCGEYMKIDDSNIVNCCDIKYVVIDKMKHYESIETTYILVIPLTLETAIFLGCVKTTDDLPYMASYMEHGFRIDIPYEFQTQEWELAIKLL